MGGKFGGNMGGLVEKLECDPITRIPAVGLRRSRRIAEIEQKIEALEEKKIEVIEEIKIGAGREGTKGVPCGKEKKRGACRVEGVKGGDGVIILDLRRESGKGLKRKKQIDKCAMKRKRKEVCFFLFFFALPSKIGDG